ncbi:MAG: glycosyltransferase family protein [Candidatus Omnitrophica bacterium]|nr:glycosyltransferase family protein [Candidatus Omnitrophota bacterium]
MKASVIIQARVGSTRLPNKVLLKVLDRTILEYVIARVRQAKHVDQVFVATTTNKNDLGIVNLAKKSGVEVFRGSENDLLDRFFQTARLFKIKNIVRITADCPLIDPDIIDSVIKLYFKSKVDYCSNILKRSFPVGLDVEIFSFNALRTAWERAGLPSEREHVTPYIIKHPDRFKLANISFKKDLSVKRWTLDRKEDFKLIKAILEALYPKNPNFKIPDVIKFLNKHPNLEKINSHILYNEGYLKSVRRDKLFQSRKK